jgi:regulatory protein
MKTVTALRTKRDQQRVSIFFDGKFTFSMGAELVAKESLQVGQELSDSQIEALVRSDHFHRCLKSAIYYLSYRPRSESEIRGQLERRGFNGDSIESVVTKLKEQGLINDMAFAQFWRDNRESFSPRSQLLTRLELRKKGVASNIIAQVVDEVSDTDNAYRAALSKVRGLPTVDYQSFRYRLGNYLKRRGFSYEVINHTLERIWQEWGGNSR